MEAMSFHKIVAALDATSLEVTGFPGIGILGVVSFLIVTCIVLYNKQCYNKPLERPTSLDASRSMPSRNPIFVKEKVNIEKRRDRTSSSISTDIDDNSTAAAPGDMPRFPFLSVSERSKCNAQQDAHTCDNSPEENIKAQEITPNSRTPIPFENDLFVGHVLMIVRSDPEDLFYKSYLQGKSRQFEIRLQGKFKRPPNDGMLWMGGEVPRKMKLGLVSYSAARTLLAFVSSSALHYSLGTKDSSDNPHLSCPLWQFAERIAVTPQNETAPSLMEEVKELAKDRKKRFRSKECPFPLDTQNTYTFSFHSQFVDVVKWKVVGVGALGRLSLGMFWDTMPLRFVMYDLTSGPCRGSNKHKITDKNYFFNFSINNTAYTRKGEATPLVEFENQSRNETDKVKRLATKSDKKCKKSKGMWRKKNSRPAGLVNGGQDDEDSMSSSSDSSSTEQQTTSTPNSSVRRSRLSSGTIGERMRARFTSPSIPSTSLIPRRKNSVITLLKRKPSETSMACQSFKPSKDTICVTVRVPGYVQAWDAELRRVISRLVLVCQDPKDSKNVRRVWTVFRSPEAMMSILPNETETGGGNSSGGVGAAAAQAAAAAALGKGSALALARRLISGGSKATHSSMLRRVASSSDTTTGGNFKNTPLYVLESLSRLLDDAIQNDSCARRVEKKVLPRTLVMPHAVTDRSLLTAITGLGMGVRPMKSKCHNEDLVDGKHVLMDAPVLRARWETCWREEWAIMSKETMNGFTSNGSIGGNGGTAGGKQRVNLWFFEPGSTKPCLFIPAHALLRIRVVTHGTSAATQNSNGFTDSEGTLLTVSGDPVIHESSELTRVFPAIELETIGKVHTVHFGDVATRNSWVEAIQESLLSVSNIEPLNNSRKSSPANSRRNSRADVYVSDENKNDSDKDAYENEEDYVNDDEEEEEEEEEEAIEEEGAEENNDTHYGLPKDAEIIAMYNLEPVQRWGVAKRVLLNGRRMYYGGRSSVSSAMNNNKSNNDNNINNTNNNSSNNNNDDDKGSAKKKNNNNNNMDNNNNMMNNTASEDASAHIQKALRMVLALSQNGTGNHDTTDVSAFLDTVSALKLVDIMKTLIDQPARASFYLNLYHTMLLHARLLISQPASLLKWASFGSQMCYQIGPDRVFSLAEVEHCLIRHSMSCPKMLGFISVSIAPTMYTEGLGLTTQRPGLSLAINHMTMSELGCVPVYDPKTVWEQIDKYSTKLILHEVAMKRDSRIYLSGATSITLPKLCQWYKSDFGRTRTQRLLTVEQLVEQFSDEDSLVARTKVSEGVQNRSKIRYARHVWIPRDVIEEMV